MLPCEYKQQQTSENQSFRKAADLTTKQTCKYVQLYEKADMCTQPTQRFSAGCIMSLKTAT